MTQPTIEERVAALEYQMSKLVDAVLAASKSQAEFAEKIINLIGKLQ